MKEKPFYDLEIRSKVLKIIKKLDSEIKKLCFKKIYALAKNPVPKSKKHILAVKKNSFLCELAIDKIRFYYEIKQGQIIIDNCIYLGRVDVKNVSKSHKAGSKGHFGRQQKDIGKLKKIFGKK
jgi:mRNA-degrading endonuclease RelE of RelBE toxin-antitoxin system